MESIGFVHRPACEVCGTAQPRILYARPFNEPPVSDFLETYYQGAIDLDVLQGGVYEVATCSKCGFIWQTYILNDAGMIKLYEEWISTEDSLNKKQKATVHKYAGYARQIEAAFRLLGARHPHKVTMLDYGMGWGYWCMMAQAYGTDVYGFEFSSRRIAFARSKGVQVIEQPENVSDYTFDFINTEQVFEHTPSPVEALKTLTQSLRKGGIIRISVPNGASTLLKQPERLARFEEDVVHQVHPLEHINCYTHDVLEKVARAAGLAPVSQPLIWGTGLLAKSYVPSLSSYGKSLVGKYYRSWYGGTLYFRKTL